jgi:ribosome-associated protein
VTPGVVLPAAALHWRAVRSSGPGGQNVNKVSTRVELRAEIALIEGMDEPARARLRSLAGSRLASDGMILVTSQLTRDQHRNLEDARTKLQGLIRRALVAPRPRHKTRVPGPAKAKRLRGKAQNSERKLARRRPSEDE